MPVGSSNVFHFIESLDHPFRFGIKNFVTSKFNIDGKPTWISYCEWSQVIDFNGSEIRISSSRVAAETNSSLAIYIAFIFMQTRGVVRDAVSQAAFAGLNKARKAKAKPQVPGYSVVRIGYAINADGSKHHYTASNMPKLMHLRRGHKRNQHHGPKNELTKEVWIHECVVNFDPKLPAPKSIKLVRLAPQNQLSAELK
jgi:hypothetical protein